MNEKKRFSPISGVGAAFVAMLAAYAAVQLIMSFGTVFFEETGIGYQIYLWLTSLVPLYLAGLPICLLILGKTSDGQCVTAASDTKSLPISKFFIALLFMFGAAYIGGLISNIFITVVTLISGREFYDPVSVILLQNPLLAFIPTVVIAPIGEEFIFRRLLIDRVKIYGEKKAILISALMFMFFHMNIPQLPFTFLAGLVLGYIYIKTGRLRYPIIIHAIQNFIGGFLSVILLNTLNGTVDILQYNTENIIDCIPQIISFALALICTMLISFLNIGSAVTAVVLFCVNRKKISFECGELEDKKPLRSPWIIGFFAVCTVMTVLNFFASFV